MKDFLDTKFWAWHCEHRPASIIEAKELRTEALALIVASVRDGDVTSIDGVDSPLSRCIQAHFDVDNWEMNALWIGSDQEWTCPCCDRTKFQIVRLGKSGQILAKLVVHHDHMGEALKAAFHSAFEQAGTTVEQTDGLQLVERMGRAFAAFDNTLICEDCNHADVLATKHIGSPRYFSFSTGQMKQFILRSEHSTHKVNYDVVDQIWAKAEPAYRLRMVLIGQVAHASATDAHWYQPTHHRADPIPTLELSRFRSGDRVIREWASMEQLVTALGPRTKTSTPDYSKWRRTKPKIVGPLPTNHLAMLRSEPTFAFRWVQLPDDWRCPVCNRTKSEIVYVGDQGKVMLVVHMHNRRGQWGSSEWFCGHCKTVLLGLKHEFEAIAELKLQNSYEFVAPQELASIIHSKPHSPHEVNSAKAQALLAEVLRRPVRIRN